MNDTRAVETRGRPSVVAPGTGHLVHLEAWGDCDAVLRSNFKPADRS